MWSALFNANPDPGLDRHQNGKSDMDRHQNDANPQHRKNWHNGILTTFLRQATQREINQSM
jgi:hypothetical protein